MSSEFLVFLLCVAAALLAAAALGGRVFAGRFRSLTGMIVRALLGVAGIALGAWVLWSFAGAGPQATPPAALAAGPPEPPRGDPVPTAVAALEDCAVAGAPPPPPDGTKASREELLAARAAFQQYDAATNSYLKCVDLTIERVTKQFPGATPVDLQTLKTLGDGAHNTAVDQEQAFADQLNTQVRAFKTKHPGS
jgi:hypothetical protein